MEVNDAMGKTPKLRRFHKLSRGNPWGDFQIMSYSQKNSVKYSD